MNEIDLHNLTHKQAVEKAEDFVLLESESQFFQCRIITGNSPNLQSKITTMLDKHSFKWYIPTHNLGQIIVVG